MLILFLLIIPIREVTEFDTIINDVQSQLGAGHNYNCDNPVSTVHECTHGINARLRGIYKQPCFYVLDNKMFTFPEPKQTLKQLAEAVPQNLRGKNYQFYLVDHQIWWNNQPTYVFDELSASINALQAKVELGAKSHLSLHSRVAEFLVYSKYVKGGKDYLDYQIKRARKLGVKCDKQL